MGWVLRKFDSLVGTAFAAVTGLAAWQLLVFIAAYQQRLGGHRDEASRALGELVGGRTGAAVGEPVLRDQLIGMARQRLESLDGAHQAIAESGVLTKPVMFFAHVDPEIALATARDFHPALPLDAPSLAFGLIGIFIGWLVWELLKAPFALLYRRRRRRRQPVF